MNDKILITGGLGYLGGRIAQKLAENPGYLLVLGTHSHSYNPLKWISGGSVVHLDLLSEDDLNAACKGVRYIIHLAATNEIESANNPENALLVNSLGTLKLLKVAQKAGIERFIYFSTARVYGFPLAGKITEESLPRPIHPYAITHKVAEDFVLAAHKNGILTGIVLRTSNAFGAPIHPNVNRWMLIFNDLCRQAVTAHKIILQSSGMQKRNFITLSDIAKAVLHFLQLDSSLCDNGLFNLGGEKTLRIIELAELIANRCKEVLGFMPPIIRAKARTGEDSDRLDYRIDKLKATGFSLLNNYNEEVDAALRFCQEEFVKK